MSGPVEMVRQSWGNDAPDWVKALAEACERSSQNKVAVQLGRSAALVSQVLRAKYAGDMVVVSDLVRGVFMAGTIDCPEFGKMPSNKCVEWRAKARSFGNANLQRAQMYRACNTCSRNEKGGRS